MTYTQPEGQLYFYSSKEIAGAARGPRFRYVTEENMYEQAVLDEVETFIEHFERRAEESSLKIPSDVEVFLATSDYDGKGWYYYCVDIRRRCLFWIDRIDLTWMAQKVHSVPHKSYLSMLLFSYVIHVRLANRCDRIRLGL